MSRPVPAIVESAVDIAHLAKQVHAAHVALRDAESKEKQDTERAEKSRDVARSHSEKAKESHEEAARRRIDLGRLLCEARKAWPARGPAAKGWGDFLEKQGIEQDSALNYMKLAGFVSRTEPDVRETAPTYADAGIDKRGRASGDGFHILVGAKSLGKAVRKIAASWPEESRPALPGLLRDLANEIEESLP